MSKQFMRIKSGINLGNMTADPVDGANGDMYYNTISSTIREFVGGQWRDAVEANNTQVLFNKTLNNLQTNASVDNSSTGATATLLPSTTGALYVINAGLTGVSGITPNGAGGQILIVENKSGNGVIIHNDDVAAIAGRRIFTGTGSDVLWQNNATYMFIYDAVNSHWMLTGNNGGGGGSGGLTSLVVTSNTSMLDNYSYIVSAPTVRSKFDYPQGVAYDDSTGNMYIADTVNQIIWLVDNTGASSIFVGTIGVPAYIDGTGVNAYFNSPQGIAFDPVTKNLYVADTLNHCIRKVTTPGAVVTTLAGLGGTSGTANGTGTAARFNNPQGVAVDATGNVWVADTTNCAIRKITSAGVTTTPVGQLNTNGSTNGVGSAATFYYPQGITYDSINDNLYVADTHNCIIRKVVISTSTVSTIAGTALTPGSADGLGAVARFNEPQGITYNAVDGMIYVTDTYNSTIRQIDNTGNVITFAGAAGITGVTNATGTAARFNNPQDIWADASGNLWVADTLNNTIRKLTTPGAVVTTFIGNAPPYGATTLMTLPSTSVIGDRIEILGNSTYGWAILANGSTCTINDGGATISAAAGGELMASGGAFNTVGLVCTTANTGWTVAYKNGPSLNSNWYGTGTGDTIITTNTTITPANIYNSWDADAVVLNYGNLTVNAGAALTVSQPCRGLIVYVNGNLTVNGAIHMTAKGAWVNPVAPARGPATPQAGVVIRRFKTGSTATDVNVDRFIGMGTAAQVAENFQPPVVNNGLVMTIPIVGGLGGAGGGTWFGGGPGQPGFTVLNGMGGGAGGGADVPIGGPGSAGTCYSGGAGGGGAGDAGAPVGQDNGGQPYGGKGGNGITTNPFAYGGGGAGNPSGFYNGGVPAGADGTGGLLMIFVKGNVIVNSGGIVQADGHAGMSPAGSDGAGGGGSGGGVVILWHGGTYSNSGTVSANGGAGGFPGNGSNRGGNGGAGTVSVQQIN